ncbi:MAG: cytochrome b/b6 domain-containing protein, partial [Acidobacteriota bacterium]
MKPNTHSNREIRTGWTSFLARTNIAALLFGAVTGLAITIAPFHAFIQWTVLIHTAIGLAFLIPLIRYCWIHWVDYKHYSMSHVVLLGYVAIAALLVCLISGIVVTWEGIFAIRTSWLWRQVHLISTLALVGTLLPHVVLILVHMRREKVSRPVGRFTWQALGWLAAGLAVIGSLTFMYSGTEYINEFPENYTLVYGEDRPFAPSLANTSTGGAFDSRSLAGSESCGTAGCHEQILAEWKPSAHRYAAMDTLFQAIQSVMAEQNGPESTRYCGGCHDPISLFAGSKMIFSEELTDKIGKHEGISCLICHSVRETDLQGNANYVVVQPAEYLWQWRDQGPGRGLRDFLIRAYPAEHRKLSKRMFKAPEYCAACHKQFIDQEINRVGWVQLQNQYDNWAASHWNHEGDPQKTVECRECHMPLVDSHDPAAGDSEEYNRTPQDGKHRSHRFLASNQFMPELLELEGWENHVDLTRRWLQGKIEIPEIHDKWAEGPIVQITLDVPESISPGEEIPVRVILTANKVGHDYPTGPLDIIQSWLEVRVTDGNGREVFRSGTRDEKHFIEPGSFMFKAEPVDQYG